MFLIFPVLRINGMTLFCNLFIEQPSYDLSDRQRHGLSTSFPFLQDLTIIQAHSHFGADSMVCFGLTRSLIFGARNCAWSMLHNSLIY